MPLFWMVLPMKGEASAMTRRLSFISVFTISSEEYSRACSSRALPKVASCSSEPMTCRRSQGRMAVWPEGMLMRWLPRTTDTTCTPKRRPRFSLASVCPAQGTPTGMVKSERCTSRSISRPSNFRRVECAAASRSRRLRLSVKVFSRWMLCCFSERLLTIPTMKTITTSNPSAPLQCRVLATT